MDITNLQSAFAGTNYTTVLSTAQHQIIGDEPTAEGGQNKGFNPFELLLASLATCTTATLKMYADRKNWDIKNISMHLQMQEIANKQHIKRAIIVTSNIDDLQKVRLLYIADKCPVHKILIGNIHIETTLEVNKV